VMTASSELEALRLVNIQRPDIAVLDINLGTGATSIAVAEELLGQQIPFLFATGYGDSIIIPAHLKHVPILQKPYDASSMLTHLENLISHCETDG
jgi:DNA-binding LytR/AlgR family response regulator